MSSPPKTRPVKRLRSQQRVSACVSDYEVDEMGHATKKKKMLFDHVIKAVDDKRYEILFDYGQVNECSSFILSVSNIASSIPLDMPVPEPQNIREEDEIVNVGEYIIDQQEEEEFLPHLPPEAEDEEAQLEINGGDLADDVNTTNEPQQDPNANNLRENEKDAANNPQHDPNGRMPGQLPKEADVPRDYLSVKRLAKEKIA
jgi:hypothetical protein